MPLYNPTSGAAIIGSGSYTGDAGADRAVAHGMSVTPKIVFISSTTAARSGFVVGDQNQDLTGAVRAVTAADATNFYVSNTTVEMNTNTVNYDWIAIG